MTTGHCFASVGTRALMRDARPVTWAVICDARILYFSVTLCKLDKRKQNIKQVRHPAGDEKVAVEEAVQGQSADVGEIPRIVRFPRRCDRLPKYTELVNSIK